MESKRILPVGAVASHDTGDARMDLFDQYVRRTHDNIRKPGTRPIAPCHSGCKLTDRQQEERESKSRFTDETGFPHTKRLTMTVSTIRRFADTLGNLIASWEDFEKGSIRHLETTGSAAFQEKWNERIAEIRNNIAQLRSLRRLLEQKLDLFQSKLDGVSLGTPTRYPRILYTEIITILLALIANAV